MDGTAVKRVCCSVHGCRIPLINQQHWFCPLHSEQRYICRIKNCNRSADPGFVTCSLETHRAWQQTQQALPQLRSQYRDAGASEVPRAGTLFDPDNSRGCSDSVTNSNLPLAGPSSHSDTSIKGQKMRNRTHNEQLFVRCCGVIISRATMYGSESITSAKVSIPFRISIPPKDT